MYTDNYQRKYQKYKKKYLEISTGGQFGDNIKMKNSDISCRDCYRHTRLEPTCENYKPCFTIEKNGITYKIWTSKVYGRTYYGWSESGKPPQSFKNSMKKKVKQQSAEIISKFNLVYDRLSSNDKNEINSLYPNLLNLFDTWLRRNKQYILVSDANLYVNFEDALGDEGDEPHIIFTFYNKGKYLDYINDIRVVEDMFYKNDNYRQELTYKNIIKKNPEVYCDTTSPDYHLYRDFCENPSYTTKPWPQLDQVYQDILK